MSVLVWKNASGEIRKSRPLNCRRAAAPASSVARRRRSTRRGRRSASTKAVGVDRLDQPADVELAGRGDQADLGLARAAALTDDEVAQEAALVAPVPRHVAAANARTCSRSSFTLSDTSLQSSIGTISFQRLGRVEAAHELALWARPERELNLVAVAPLLVRRDDRPISNPSRRPIRRSASSTCSALTASWRRTAALARARRMVGDVGDAIRRRLQDLDRARLGVGLLALPTTARTRHRQAPATNTT